MPWIWEDSMWIRNKGNKPTILIFARNADNRLETKVFPVNNFDPYFYAPADAPMFPSSIVHVSDVRVLDAFGREVRRCTCNLPSDVPIVRKAFEWTCEADVMFDIRFMIDRKIRYGFTVEGTRLEPVQLETYMLPRFLRFDIEVKSPPDIMPDPDHPVWPIVSFQYMDSYTKEIGIITNGVPCIAEDQIACTTEIELLEQMMEVIQQYDPDALSGWYTNGFDLPYIINRAEALGVRLNAMTRNPSGRSIPKCDKREHGEYMIKIPGRQCFDMLPAFKKWYKAIGELEAYDLKSISKQFGKFEYDDYGPHMQLLFDNEDWETFITYGRNDVIALDKIDTAIGLIDFYEGLRYIAGVKLEDTLKNSKIIESLLAHKGIKPMPTRNYSVSGETFSGAVVLKPQIGVHNNVAVFDAAALYPTIIRGLNISPDIDGLIPIVITEILNEREKLRAIRMAGKADASTKNKETVLKFIANSFYGVLGWPQFRLYKPELAAQITRLGRSINQFLQDHAKHENFITVYGDTDSVFLAGITSIDDGMVLQASFNEALKTWAKDNKSTLNPTVKFEKLYRRLLFKKVSSTRKVRHNKKPVDPIAAKKRYAGHLIWKDGQDENKVSYTGIEIKRSDQAKLTKDVLKQFLDCLLLEDDQDAACRTVRVAYQDVIKARASLYDISMPKGVKDREADTAWVRGIKNAEQLFGGKFPQGVKPRLIYLKGEDDAICIHDESDLVMIKKLCRIDWELMADKVITNKMKTFVESIGQDWNIIIKDQKTLTDWF